MFSDVAHKEKLRAQELAVHLIGLNGEEPAEPGNGLSMQSLSGVRPGKGVGVEVVPRVDEGHNGFSERWDGGEMLVVQALLFEDAKPYLDHVQPGGVERYKMNDNAFVGRLEPLAALCPGPKG